MDPSLETYLIDLQRKLKERELQEFWVMADRADFKPIKAKMDDIEKLLKDKVQYYRNKRIAQVHCYVNPSLLQKRDMFVMSIKVMICEISDDGDLDHAHGSTYGLRVNFYPEDFTKIKFTLKLVESLLRLAAGKKKQQIQTDTLNGLSYEDFKAKVAKKGLTWEFA